MIFWLLHLCLIGGTYAFPTGAPNTTCVTMTPKHSPYTKQNISSPYILNATLKQSQDGLTAEVQIWSRTHTYKGFLLIGMNASKDGGHSGGFISLKSTAKYLCNGTQGITHTSNTTKQNETFYWHVPFNYCGNLSFRATVVFNFKDFWVNISSANLTIPCAGNTTTTTTSPSKQTSPPTTTASPGPPTTTLHPTTTNGAPSMRGTYCFLFDSVLFTVLLVFPFYWIG